VISAGAVAGRFFSIWASSQVLRAASTCSLAASSCASVNAKYPSFGKRLSELPPEEQEAEARRLLATAKQMVADYKAQQAAAAIDGEPREIEDAAANAALMPDD
jgi:hypothetical protein